MPIPIVRKVFAEGFDSVPFVVPLLKSVPWIGGVVLLKRYFGGARNGSERDMHGKVVLMTVSAEPQDLSIVRATVADRIPGRHIRCW